MSARLIESIAALRAELGALRRAGRTIGLVPTMGALHEGHGALIGRARSECDCVVVSVFVNPIQFNQREDFDRYPRALDGDLAFCDSLGADIVFAPGVSEMYPLPLRTFVEVERVSEHLCGRYRPGHFRGVATVVAKLFLIVGADRAYFGEKDAQQLAVIRRMVRDLDFPIEIAGVETVREPDGLALSSRNQRLNSEERRIAPVLYRALEAARERIEGGERDAARIRGEVERIVCAHPEVRLEYFEAVDPEEMQPLARVEGDVRLVIAAWLGGTRLIDNVSSRAAGTIAH